MLFTTTADLEFTSPISIHLLSASTERTEKSKPQSKTDYKKDYYSTTEDTYSTTTGFSTTHSRNRTSSHSDSNSSNSPSTFNNYVKVKSIRSVKKLRLFFKNLVNVSCRNFMNNYQVEDSTGGVF